MLSVRTRVAACAVRAGGGRRQAARLRTARAVRRRGHRRDTPLLAQGRVRRAQRDEAQGAARDAVHVLGARHVAGREHPRNAARGLQRAGRAHAQGATQRTS
eukprot:4388242-Prymnesium_polylepis.1